MELHGGLVSIAMESRPLLDHYQTIQSALVWVIADGPHAMRDEPRKVIAWQAIEDEAADLRLDETRSVSYPRIFRKHGTI